MPAKKYFTEEERAYARHLRYIANKHRVLEYNARPEVRERINRNAREFRKNNPEWVALHNAKRRQKRGTKRIKLSKEEAERRIKEGHVRYRMNNLEKCLARSRQWRIDNPERYKKSLRENYDKNKESRCAQTNAWKKANPEKVRAMNSARDAKIKKQLHPDANKKKMEDIYKESSRLSSVTGIDHEADHIIAINSKGWHHEDNLSPLTASLNSSKQDDPFWLAPSMEYKDWRDVPRHLWPIDLVPKYLALIEQHKGETIRWDSAA